jgi:tRNA A-37 threonylcarbamoyl transferase component Bud32
LSNFARLTAFAHIASSLAPLLINDGTKGPRYGLFMIAMGYVRGQTSVNLVNFSLIESVTKAIKLLHEQDLVFGDLRTPNLLVNESGK